MCKELLKLGNKKTNKNLKLGKQSQKAFHQWRYTNGQKTACAKMFNIIAL